MLRSAHGGPKSYITAGDPYKRHVEECVALISSSVRRKLQDRVDKDSRGALQWFKNKVNFDVKLPGTLDSRLHRPTKYELSMLAIQVITSRFRLLRRGSILVPFGVAFHSRVAWVRWSGSVPIQTTYCGKWAKRKKWRI